jgi:hypothetical protein
MLNRLFSILLLIVMFALSQQAAATHELSHYHDLAGSTHHPEKSSHQQVCEKCLAYSGLDSVSPVQTYIIPISKPNRDGYFYQDKTQIYPLESIQLIRGPPSFS